MSKQTAYQSVYDDIKHKISRGEYSIGDLLPTEPRLESEYGVSRTTVRKAIDLLSKDGLVSAKQGRGTEVLNPKASQRLNYITSFSATLLSRGGQVYSKGTHIDLVLPPHHVAKALMLEPDEDVIRIQRVQYYNGNPICIMKNYLNKSIAPDLPSSTDTFISLYQLLKLKYNIQFDSAEETITAENADFTDAQILNVPVGTALLISNRVSYLAGKPAEISNLKIIGNQYSFYVYLVGAET